MINKVKFFLHRDLWNDAIYFSKDIGPLLNLYDRDIFGIIETEQGDVVFNIEFNCDNEPYVWKKFMHITSFLNFNNDLEMKFLDKSSENYINHFNIKQK